MVNIIRENKVKIYNDGILIIEGEDVDELIELVEVLLIDNSDSWEVELLNNILYTINNNLSTMEVA